MDHLHEMVIEDEIVMCGAVFLLGLIVGAAAKVLTLLRRRRAA